VLVLAQGQPETLYPYLTDTLTAVMLETGFRYAHIARCCRLNSSKDSRGRADLTEMLAAVAGEVRARYG
jgi:hypothetical protein